MPPKTKAQLIEFIQNKANVNTTDDIKELMTKHDISFKTKEKNIKKAFNIAQLIELKKILEAQKEPEPKPEPEPEPEPESKPKLKVKISKKKPESKSKPKIKVQRKTEDTIIDEIKDILKSDESNFEKLEKLEEKVKFGVIKEGELDTMARQFRAERDVSEIEVKIGKNKGKEPIEDPQSAAKRILTDIGDAEPSLIEFNATDEGTEQDKFKHIPKIRNRHPGESIHNAFWKRAGVEHQMAFFKFADTGIASVLRNSS
jgi:hypothetical protein